MTSKIQALVWGAVSGFTGYLAYFLGLPPELQSGVLGQLISICPPDWQPAAAATTKTLSVFLGLYATFKASQSGPQTPPKNPPTQ